jgi:ribose transport system permease protein
MRARTYLFALVLAAVLVVVNIIVLPAFADPHSYAPTFAGLAPFALVGVASTPSIMSGGGGIDVSIGPMTGLIAIIYVVYLQPNGMGSALLAIPIVLLIGAGFGALNGVMITKLRYQPVIATLGMYFVLGGIGEQILATPRQTGGWTNHLAGSIGPIPGGLILIAVPLVIWALLLKRTAFIKTLRALGGNDVAAYTAGINVANVRIFAYALGGFFAAIAAFSLTALTRDADSTLGVQYTLVALAAACLGGTIFGGGRGGVLGAVFGAACIYLIQNLLTNLDVSSFWVQVVYGSVLVVAVVYSHGLVETSSDQEALA